MYPNTSYSVLLSIIYYSMEMAYNGGMLDNSMSSIKMKIYVCMYISESGLMDILI